MAIRSASCNSGVACSAARPHRGGLPARGGSGDIGARLIAQPLQQRLGQTVVVDYRPGAGGNLATAAVVKARPDGGPLIQVSSKNAIDAPLYKNLTFDFVRDIAMVAGMLQGPLVMVSLHETPALPGIPPLASVVPSYEVSAWLGLGAPKATPKETIAALNKAVNASLAEPAIADRIRELGAEPMIMSPRELDAFVAADTEKWAKAVKFSGATVD